MSTAPDAPSSGYRWRILALLFFATTVNYMDRSILAVLGLLYVVKFRPGRAA